MHGMKFFEMAGIGLAVLLTPLLVTAEDFGGLEGVVIIGENASSSSSDQTSENEEVQVQSEDIEEKLAWSLDGLYLMRLSDQYFNIFIDIGLVNWKVQTESLSNIVSANLIYQDEYIFSGEVDFGSHTQIGVLEEVDGSIMFTVPDIVAFAGPSALQLEMIVDGEETVEPFDLTKAVEESGETVNIPFSYDERTTDELELSLGDSYLTDTWNGDSNDAYKWIIQDISLINWSDKIIKLEDSMYLLLTYMNKYGFEAQGDFPVDEIKPLEIINVEWAFHIPNIVAEAKDGMTGLHIRVQDDEWEREFSVDKSILESRQENGVNNLSSGKIGIQVKAYMGSDSVPKGVQITRVEKGSPAELVNLKKWDIITAINGQSTSSTADFRKVMSKYSPGTAVTLTIYTKAKNGKEYSSRKVDFELVDNKHFAS